MRFILNAGLLILLVLSTLSSCNRTKAEAIDLGLSVKWANYNVGATKPEDLGGLFAWGDTSGDNTSDNIDDYLASIPTNNICGSSCDIARRKWGGSWRLPTKEELDELHYRCKWIWAAYNGTNGYKVIGPNGNSIFIPAAGMRNGKDIIDINQAGGCWSGTYGRYGNGYAYCLRFNKNGVSWYGGSCCAYGYSIRPVQE